MKLPPLPDLDQFISHGCGFDPVTGEPMDTIYKVDADRLLKEYGRACAKAALEAAAKECENRIDVMWSSSMGVGVCRDCAAAIRKLMDGLCNG